MYEREIGADSATILSRLFSGVRPLIAYSDNNSTSYTTGAVPGRKGKRMLLLGTSAAMVLAEDPLTQFCSLGIGLCAALPHVQHSSPVMRSGEGLDIRGHAAQLVIQQWWEGCECAGRSSEQLLNSPTSRPAYLPELHSSRQQPPADGLKHQVCY
mmetsp:Transcript_17918/g.50148  ORF Transcript_17918/g.50148 Transcript_17918/m.50148 type:complete len:155 (-) Transcript_17918:1482-1946(-)